MMGTMSEQEGTVRKRLPWWVKWVVFPLVILALPCAAWLVWLLRARAELGREIEAIRARGEPIEWSQMAPPPVARRA